MFGFMWVNSRKRAREKKEKEKKKKQKPKRRGQNRRASGTGERIQGMSVSLRKQEMINPLSRKIGRDNCYDIHI